MECEVRCSASETSARSAGTGTTDQPAPPPALSKHNWKYTFNLFQHFVLVILYWNLRQQKFKYIVQILWFFFLPKLTEMLKKILAVSHLRRISGIFSLYQAFGHQNLFHTVKATTILACTIIHRILLQVTSWTIDCYIFFF